MDNTRQNKASGLSENFGNTPDSFKNNSADETNRIQTLQISLPKGGGAIRGIEEKFQVNSVTGTASFGIPIPLSPSRNGFTPSVGLGYNSGAGNSAFGLGWNVGIPEISRKTEKRLPRYDDESDTFILSGAEDLVPYLEKQGANWGKPSISRSENGVNYSVMQYRPRIEGLFARIEKWKNNLDGDVHWRTVSRDNIHSYYGVTPESRVCDPKQKDRVFRWLLCRTYDDKGNIAIYKYKPENFSNIPSSLSEKNKINNCAQTYIKMILYGNKTPYYLGDDIPQEDNFLFKIVFDYGEHDRAVLIPKEIFKEKNNWIYREDAFSSFRSGFEIRTWRICNRVLVFHCFDTPDLPHSPYLVKSLDLLYDRNNAFATLIKARQNGHKWDSAANNYSTKHLPDLDITYQAHEWNTDVHHLSLDNSVHAPSGLADKRYLWIDLYSEGIAGILTEQADAWFYKSNLGNGEFSHARQVAPKPSTGGLSSNRVSIQELEGNGIKCLVKYGSEPKGFFELIPDEEWMPFKNFETFPNINLTDPNMRFMDLTGDGLADLLITRETALEWYEGEGKKGFKVSKTLARDVDEEKGPAILFEDRAQRIFLADMSGDGLTDIVRITNSGICYWPNLGYGRFGAKVNMDHAPAFDHPDTFNPSNLRLADIDGSGTMDVVYLGKNDFRVWMNLSGNAWTRQPKVLPAFPDIHHLSDVMVIDFLGTGTACIVYSSSLPQNDGTPIQYIDIMGSRKPNLLVSYQNNCGKTVSIEYKSSTHFYLEDKKQGNNWVTKLPFPVHCISKTTITDAIRETIFTNSYRYRHGYFDHHEREFRGFARVEQLDTESFSRFKVNSSRNVVEEQLHQPPVKTISWFHTGAYLRHKKILHQCETEYFQNASFQEYDLPEPEFDNDLTALQLQDAYRAFKGMVLREEVYAEDDTDKAMYPYSVSQSTVDITMVQPDKNNHPASFLVVPAESVSYGYDRNPGDPRIQQSYILQSDELGNVTRSASVIYPRIKRPSTPNDIPDKVWDEQNKLHVVYSETFFTNDIIENNIYRLRVGYETRTFDVSGISQPAGFYIPKKQIDDNIAGANPIFFEDEFTSGYEKRLISHNRVYFYKDDLSGSKDLGKLSELGIAHKSYQLALTKDLVSNCYGTKVSNAMLANAKYEHLEGDDNWWVHSGTILYQADPGQNFYTPVGARDLFGNESRVKYDTYTLLPESTEDAIGNTASSINDYRTLSPVMMTDPNLNRSAVETDELGLVVKTAVMGKQGASEGDTLDDPSARMEYDLFNWQNNQKPNVVHTFIRKEHGGSTPQWQESYLYSDGGGNVIMTKAQAEAGKAKQWNEVSGQVELVDADPRWVGNGRTVLDNKGNPVKQYEPYFSVTHEYEDEEALVESGVTPILYYDPVGRNIEMRFPDGTFSKNEFDAWSSRLFDVNDTVKDSQWYADRGSPDPDTDTEPLDPEHRAAWLAAGHDNTPGIKYANALGEAFWAVTDFGAGKTTRVYTQKDPAGRYARMFDQAGRSIFESHANLLGMALYSKNAEKGEQWVFSDAMGRPVKIWDNDIREFRSTYDQLHRPVSTYVRQGDTEILFGHVIYGDLFSDIEASNKNLKGKTYQLYDQAGVVTIKEVDFKGNAVKVDRKLVKTYKKAVDWKPLEGLSDISAIEAAAAPLLESETFSSSSVVDALNRPKTVTLPDQSIVKPAYNIAGALDSLQVKIRGQGGFTTFLEGQDYDAKGQRQFAEYGNGLISRYFYDPKTFRLVNLVTRQLGVPDSQSLQNLQFTFDPAGNIVQIKDEAQQTHYFNNAVVKPESKFEYNAAYQLIKATGREHAGLGANSQRDHSDLPFLNQMPHANDSSAVRQYIQQFEYDDCRNIKLMRHIAPGGNWRRHYRYEYEDDPSNLTNRLKSTSLPGDLDTGPYSAVYTHDLHGNMVEMPHVTEMVWNFMDQLAKVDLGGGGTAYYTYGGGGGRIRKVIERPGNIKTERIYLGAVEIYREFSGLTKKLERSTLHVSDNTGRIAQVDTKLLDEDSTDTANPLNTNLIRYQYANHLGSSCMETDETGTVISYEEYHPFGTSAYRNRKSDVDLSLKRYRFSGKEKDDETGLYYFGARYYADWLGRWTSSDPAGFVSGPNLFVYCSNNPIMFHDPNGMNDDRIFGLPSELNLPDNPTTSQIAEAYREHVAGLGYQWTRDGQSNPAPEFQGRGRWYFGIFDPEHIPAGDPLGITGSPAPQVSTEPAPSPPSSPVPTLSPEPSPPVMIMIVPVQRGGEEEEEERFGSVWYEQPFRHPHLYSPAPFRNTAIRFTNPGVNPNPPILGMRARAPGSQLFSAAEHALGEHLGSSRGGSRWLSASVRRGGASGFHGTPYWISIDRAIAGGAEFVSHPELIQQMEQLGHQPRFGPRSQMWLRAQAGEGEVLFSNRIPAGAIETRSMRYLKGFGRGATAVAVVITVYDMGNAGIESYETGSAAPIGAETIRQVGGWGGGWLGFKAGFAIGAVAGVETGPGLIVTGLVGGVVLGTAGYFGADWIADYIHEN
ncbi:MAG: SpvB/TcaC N-terminal domain-containing protein [Pseudomonadota bacterium]